MKANIKSLWLIALAAFLGFGLGWKSRHTKEADPALEAAEALKSQRGSRLAGNEPEGSQSRRERRGSDLAEGGALDRLFGSVGNADGGLDRLFEQALRDPNPILRRLAFSKLLEAMTPENAASMREQLVAIGAAPDQWRDFHYAWGALDGKAAFASATTSPEADLAATMTGWAAADPAGALALIDNLPAELQGQREELVASVVQGLADNNRSLTTDYVVQLARDGNGQANQLIGLVADEALRAEGPEAASRWSEALPDGPLKGSAMGRVADAYVRKNPEEAARWVQQFAGEAYAAAAIEETGGGWADTDPVAAVAWLEGLPQSNGQSAGMQSAFNDWEDSDPEAASQYLTNMANSPLRDSSISGFATGYAWQNPQVALAWAQEIRDPALRERSITQAGRAYYRRDPDGALAWMDASGLPAESRQQILQSDRRRR